MKRSLAIVSLLSLTILCGSVIAMGGPKPEESKAPEKQAGVERPAAFAEKVFLIDDYESGSLKFPRDWWVFDVKADVVSTDTLKDGEALEVGLKSLSLAGSASNFYVGGIGTYLAKEGQDLSKYNSMQIDIYGNGPDSGSLKIELYDDDNGNWQVEQDKTKNYVPFYDDKWTNEIKVDWSGWKRVVVPLADFVDENPAIGDDIWNPQQMSNSGGLLQLQLICIATKSKGKVGFDLDNVALIVE
ncbi:MAG: carbohydrate binding domain-containing protein [Candidatus Margulisiibacteriota bacterium]